MRKHFYGSVLFLCILALCISGCGGSGGSAADPMGTATVQFIDESGKILVPEEGGGLFGFLIEPGESRQFIVKVTNARSDGSTAPVVHEKVTFTLLTPQNGGRVTMVKEYTDSSGRAVGMYTAGNNFEFDNIRATTDAGASAECSVYKTGALLGKKVASVTASSTQVVAGETSTIVAIVTDGYGNPVSGEPVLFTLSTNNSGARFVSDSGAGVASIQVATDVSGEATALYYAGDDSSDEAVVYDMVKAAIANGSAKYVTITRNAGTPGTDTGAELTSFTASETTVNAGQMSVITATVYWASLSTEEENTTVTVTFTIPSNESGATFVESGSASHSTTFLLPWNVHTDISVTYKAGTNNPGIEVEDLVKATLGSGPTQSVIITRSGSLQGYTISLTANPATLLSRTGTSAITATVKDSNGNNASGMSVHFEPESVLFYGTLDTNDRTTDASGLATVTFTSTATSATTNNISACIDLDRNGSCSSSEPNATVVVTIP